MADGVLAGNRRPFAEDGTDFSSYATGASARFTGCDRCRVVVACHADLARARPDRSRRQGPMRLLRAVPRRAVAAERMDPYRGRPDRAGSAPAQGDHRLRPHLFDGERARPGAGDRSPDRRAEGAPGHLALQQPHQEFRAGRARHSPFQGFPRNHHQHHRRQRSAAARRDDDRGPRLHHPLGEGAGQRARHLCRCLGVLAQESRDL